jgi:phospholipid/cholesterol/gamma-HCH transport system permease protein
MGIPTQLGSTVVGFFAQARDLIRMFGAAWLGWFRLGNRGRILFQDTIRKQLYFTAMQAWPMVAVIALITGFGFFFVSEVIIRQSQFGYKSLFSRYISLAVMVEIAPLIVALLVISRSGTAISTELANMRINREIQLLQTLGIDINYFLVLPRLIGMSVSTFLLSVLFTFAALIGGWALCQFYDLQIARQGLTISWQMLTQSIEMPRVIVLTVKSLLFGVTIGLVNCYWGLSARSSYTEVPRVAIRGVVSSQAAVLVLNVILAVFYVIWPP